jgi:sugar lactone lactonase YvrE
MSTIAGTGQAGYDTEGETATESRLNTPTDIEVGPDGSVFFVDRENYRIRKINERGELEKVAGTGREFADVPRLGKASQIATDVRLGSVDALTVDSAGTVYFTETSYYHHVLAVSPAGTLENLLGGPAGRSVRNPTEFYFPSGLAAAGDQLLVADTSNDRVVRIQLRG